MSRIFDLREREGSVNRITKQPSDECKRDANLVIYDRWRVHECFIRDILVWQILNLILSNEYKNSVHIVGLLKRLFKRPGRVSCAMWICVQWRCGCSGRRGTRRRWAGPRGARGPRCGRRWRTRSTCWRPRPRCSPTPVRTILLII